MKLYKAIINPTSNFSTPLRGDTFFGQICWGIKYIFGEERLKELLKNYDEKPFLVVSDGFVSGYLPKPKMPSKLLGENPEEKKQNRKKIWLTIDDFLNGNFNNAKTKKEAGEDKEDFVIRNSINYKEFKTDDSGFAPYTEEEFSLTKKDIFFLIDDNFSLDELKKVLNFIGHSGYGKDSTIGKGRFEVEKLDELNINNSNKKYFMALSPVFIEGIKAKNIYYDVFVRFGKLGYERANINPFKKPIVFADTGSVFELEEKVQYIGKAVKNISTYEDVIQQGYAIVLGAKNG